jgi:plastocyanin
VAALLAGCGAGGFTSSGAGAAPASNDQVTIKGYAFAPNPITVQAGSTVTWENDDSTEHTATASDGSFDTGTIQGHGATAKATVRQPGTYDYVCEFHPFMKGTITVEP